MAIHHEMRTTHCPQPNMSGWTEPSVPSIGAVSSVFSARPHGCDAFLNARRVSYAQPTIRALFGAVVYRSLNAIGSGRVPSIHWYQQTVSEWPFSRQMLAMFDRAIDRGHSRSLRQRVLKW
jgi:hypothetical protein